eukprot:6655756-Alexandrium_andersonii.AAC.1
MKRHGSSRDCLMVHCRPSAVRTLRFTIKWAKRAHHNLGAVAKPKTPFLMANSCPAKRPGSPSRGCSM